MTVVMIIVMAIMVTNHARRPRFDPLTDWTAILKLVY